MQTTRRTTGFFVLLPMFAFYLAACGGGGGGGNSPPPPTVTTNAATGITVHTALLNGTVNPHAQATNASFEWGTDNTLSIPTLTPAQAIGAGSADNSVSAPIAGLALGTTYYYRVVATNASGTQKGAIASFTTALPNSPPSVATNAASSVTISGAVLNGTVGPNELATTAVFEWGTDPTLTTFTSTSLQTLGAGTTSLAVTASLSGLNPLTTYYFRVAATNSAGTTKGLIVSFSTIAQPPTVTTAAATNITINNAVLNGSVNPNGLAVIDAHFEWGTDSALATFTSTSLQTLAAGFAGQPITASLSGLIPGTTYYFRVTAINSEGTSKGTIVSFITTTQPPTVATAAADNITIDNALLNGSVNPNGLATTAVFEWGTDPTMSTLTSTPSQSLGAGATSVGVTASLSGLIPGTTYYFRVAATNSVGTSRGLILSFSTLANPPPIANAGPDQNVFQGKTVTLNGSGSSDGFGGTITHQWAQTAGPSVTLSSSTSANPTFTAPQVALPSALLTFRLTVTSSRGPTATDNVNVTVKYGFFDDFSTDTTGTYSDSQTLGTSSTFTYDADAKAALVTTTGIGNALSFYRDFGIAGPAVTDTGVFSLIFFPTVVHGAGNGITIRLGETFPPPGAAYYEISTIDNTVRKVFAGVLDISTPFPSTLDPAGIGYTLKIRFSPSLTTVEIDGTTVATLSGGAENSIGAFDFTVETKNMDAYYDDIKLEAAP